MHPQCLAFSQNPDDKGYRFLVNAGNFVPDCVVTNSRRENRSIQWILGISQQFQLQTYKPILPKDQRILTGGSLAQDRKNVLYPHTFAFRRGSRTSARGSVNSTDTSIMILFVPVFPRQIMTRPVRFWTPNGSGVPMSLKNTTFLVMRTSIFILPWWEKTSIGVGQP